MRGLCLGLMVACTGNPPETYDFAGLEGDSSVAYGGQVFRQVLLEALAGHVDGLTARLDDGFAPDSGDVAAELGFYLDFDDVTSAGLPHGILTDPPALQVTFGELGSGKDLVGKVAGNDTATDHADWSTGFAGWGATGSVNPEGLVRSWIGEIDAAATGWSRPALGPDGTPVSRVTVTSEGRDLGQLLDTFVRGAVAFSQGTDDYLDDDVEGKGLLADHTALVEGESYTALEHAWDEGFGYFGADRSFGLRADADIVDAASFDADGDDRIDVLTEWCAGDAVLAAQRDREASFAVDLTRQAWDGFLEGRHLIATTSGPLSDSKLEALQAHRDAAVAAWEQALAATVLRDLDAVVRHTDAIGTDDYDFERHAQSWSAMKGRALAFQFNPRSALSAEGFSQLHEALGMQPWLSEGDPEGRAAYRAGLVEATALLETAFAEVSP